MVASPDALKAVPALILPVITHSRGNSPDFVYYPRALIQ
jgi:hypothetical protein